MPPNLDTDELYTVPGITGVDLSLQIAGPGRRAYAFVIDWHIRLILAIGWLMTSVILIGGGLSHLFELNGWTAGFVLIPTYVLYIFYHPIVEVSLHGQTPGKRMAGVRVVTQQGGQPSTNAVLIRNLFRLIDALPVFYVVGLVSAMLTQQRVRIGDMAAGTLLIVNDHNEKKAFSTLNNTQIESTALELAEQLLERWKNLSEIQRINLARSLLQRINPQSSTSFDAATADELHTQLRELIQQARS